MGWFLAATIGSFLFLSIRFPPEWLKRTSENEAVVVRLWNTAIIVTGGVVAFLALRNLAEGRFGIELSNDTTWVIAQFLCGAVLGAIIAFLLQRFSALAGGRHPPKLDMVFHVWIGAATVLLLAIGIFGSDTRRIFSNISNINVGNVSIQISTAVKSERADLTKYADNKSDTASLAARRLEHLQVLLDAITQDIAIIQLKSRYKIIDLNKGSEEITAHNHSIEAITLLIKPMGDCLKELDDAGTDRELTRAALREAVVVLHQILEIRTNPISDDVIDTWGGRLNKVIEALQSDAKKPADCKMIDLKDFRAFAKLPGDRSLRNLAREPNFLLTVAYMEAFDGNLDAAKNILENPPPIDGGTVIDSGRINYDYYLGLLSHDTGDPANVALPLLERVLAHGQDLAETLDSIEAGRAPVPYNKADRKQFAELRQRAYHIEISAMNAFAYDTAQGIAVDDNSAFDFMERAQNFTRLLLHQLENPDAKAAFDIDPQLRFEVEDTIGFVGLVIQSKSANPDEGYIKRSVAALCAAKGDLASPDQKDPQLLAAARRHIELAKLLLGSLTPCLDVQGVRWRESEL